MSFNKWWIFLCVVSPLLQTVFLFFSLDEPSEFSQSEAEGLYQEGQKSTQTGPDKQLQTNDFAPVS